MLKTALRFVLILLVVKVSAQEANEMVTVSGKIFNAKDSSSLTANFIYAKLPYYDDMGQATSRGDDGFSISLVKGNTYEILIRQDGFDEFTKNIEIAGEGLQSEDFYIESDEVELIKLENLTFSTGSATIGRASYTELDELAAWMGQNPTVTVQLEGHTDFRGNAAAQINLSQARVDAVKEYLIKQRVKKTRILTKAFGGTQPLSREDTEEAKALNRRVEVRVIRQ